VRFFVFLLLLLLFVFRVTQDIYFWNDMCNCGHALVFGRVGTLQIQKKNSSVPRDH